MAVDIEQLLARLSIEYERRGVWLWAPCPHPDHEENTPSWHIRDDADDDRHGFHKCFGCGRSGYPVQLVERVLGLDRDAARDWLKSSENAAPPKLGVEVEFEEPEVKRRFELPSGSVLAPLAQWVTPARRYAEERGITAAQVDEWGLGYAVDGRLAGRVVLPIRDRHGVVVSYAARDYTKRALRKYLAPSTSEGANRIAVFGEHLWRERDCLVLIEGPVDALAVARVGYQVGAIQGSDWKPAHLLKLRRWRVIVIASDNDQAGNKLASAIREQVGADRESQTRVGLAEVPEDEDCASLPAFALSSMLRLAVDSAV